MTIRMDSELKTQFDALCDEFGMSTNTAFNIFARMVVRSRKIPFIIEAPDNDELMRRGKAAFKEIRSMAVNGQLPDLSNDDINEEIRLTREGKRCSTQ